MSAVPDLILKKQVAQALEDSEHLRIDPSRLKDVPGYSLMIGGFGTVRVAKLDDQIVAVKELRITGAPEDRVRFSMRFARELKVWSRLDHPNLLRLSGFYMDQDISIAQFISPFYIHGHIRKYINDTKPDQDARLSLAKDTALGLQYLHELQIVHGDLKELNVLVDPAPRALLCDYGLAKIVDPDGADSGLTTSGLPMSVHFSSPELMNGSRPNQASDVWAWGCLFLKIVSDISPYHGTNDITCVCKIVQGTPPADVSGLTISSNMCNMLELCWDQDPLARPKIVQCVEMVDSIQRLPSLAPSQDDPTPVWDTRSQVSMSILESSESCVPLFVAFSPDSSLVASGIYQNRVYVREVESGAPVARLERAGDGGRKKFAAAFFSLDGNFRVVGSTKSEGGWISTYAVPIKRAPNPGGYASWKYSSWKPISRSPFPVSKAVQSLVLSPDGSLIAAGRDAGGGVYHSPGGESWELLFNVDSHGERISSVAFSPTGKWLASCGQDGVVQIWDTAIQTDQAMHPKRPEKRLEQHARPVLSAAFSPDGRRLASGSDDGTIIAWDVSTWKSVATLNSNSDVTSITFSPDSTRLASGFYNGNIQIWNAKNWTSLLMLRGHGYGPIRLAFSPDGRRIASASHDKTVRIWHEKPMEISELDSEDYEII